MYDLKEIFFVVSVAVFLVLLLCSVLVFTVLFLSEQYYPHEHTDLVIGDTCYCNVENFMFDECEGLVTFSCGVGDFVLQCSDFELVEHHFGWFGKEK